MNSQSNEQAGVFLLLWIWTKYSAAPDLPRILLEKDEVNQ